MNDFKKKLFIRLGIALGASALLAGVLLYIRGDIKSLQIAIQTTRSSLTARSQAIGNLAELRNDADEAKKDISILQNALPVRESLFVFSDEINRLAQQGGLTSVFTFGTEIPGTISSPGRMAFIANVSGSYESILDFMKAFESSRYFTSVKSFDLVSQGANTTGYQAIVSGEVFYKSI